MKKQWNWKRTAGVLMACVVCCVTVGGNGSVALANDGTTNQASKVETFRSYDGKDSEKSLFVEVPKIEGQEGYIKEVNDRISYLATNYEAKADQEIGAYKEAFLATGGTEEEFEAKDIQVNIGYEVKSETEDVLSLVFFGHEDWNASTAVTEYYNINLKDNTEITLEDLLGSDYINIANESIQAQIAADDSGLYFDEAMGGFTTITPDTNFYINEAGNPVIVFQKYEIAAGAAGMPEFEIVK